MKTSRLEAFSDGVLAIVITIMVLEFEAPEETSVKALLPILPILLNYLVSFVYLGIYWTNHHHMLHVTETINGNTLWANLHLLFWLSLIPFATSWVGQSNFSRDSLMLYGMVLLMSSISFYILRRIIAKNQEKEFLLSKLFYKNYKLKASILLYIVGILGAFLSTWLSMATYLIVAVLWFFPDKRLEK